MVLMGAIAVNPSGSSPVGRTDEDAAGPVVLVVPAARPVGDSLTVAASLAEAWGAGLVLVRPVVVPRQTPLDGAEAELEPHREDLAEIQAAARTADPGLTIEAGVRLGHHLDHVLADAAEELGAACVLLPGLFPTGPNDVASGDEIEAILEGIPGPAVAYREPSTPREIGSVLAAVAGGPHSPAVARMASGLAARQDARLELVHVLDPEPSESEREEALQRLGVAAGRLEDEAEVALVEAEDVVEALLEEARGHDALVIGAPTRNRLRHLLYGSTSRSVERRAPAWTFTVSGDGP